MTIIPAATTPTANTNTEPTEINSVQDLLEQLKCIHEYPQQADLRYWFRGQPNSAHLLLPGVYRKNLSLVQHLQKQRLTPYHMSA